MISTKVQNAVTYFNASPKQLTQMEKDLTFNNPAYANVQRYGNTTYTNVPPYLMYYRYDNAGNFVAPIGYVPPFECKVVSDDRVNAEVTYPPFKLKLRGDQVTSANSFLQTKNEFPPFFSVQLPTGKGKSILGVYLASKLKQKTLIIVHKDDLVKSWLADIKLAFDNRVTPGLIKAQSKTIGAQITVATIQTLNRLPEKKLNELFNRFGFIIQDEMHHCPASSFELVNNFNARYRLGLTATPERKDGLAFIMQLYFGSFCYTHTYKASDEDILPIKVVRRECDKFFIPVCKRLTVQGTHKYVITELDIPKGSPLPKNHVRLSNIDYDLRPKVSHHYLDSVATTANMQNLLDDVISEYKKGHSCLVFFSRKESCRDFGKLINRTYNRKEPKVWFNYFYGDNTDEQNDLTKETASTQRQFITITTYAKATEGTNCPQWEVAFLASSINDGKNTEQAVGRIRRTFKNKINPVLVYDYRFPYIYALSSHGATRDTRYKKLIPDTCKSRKRRNTFSFSRGF